MSIGLSNPPTKLESVLQPSSDSIYVREFLPRSAKDPTLPILRELFVHSFDDVYKNIEAQLKLKTKTNVKQWLHETFDEMQDNMISRKQRCFVLYSSEKSTRNNGKERAIGFLTLTDEKGSVYIAQFAIDAENKRRGYGTCLLQHLRSVYPPGTFYCGLCRRINDPAMKFYLKQGAKFIDNEEIATKYGYDQNLYTGFQFTDAVTIQTQSR